MIFGAFSIKREIEMLLPAMLTSIVLRKRKTLFLPTLFLEGGGVAGVVLLVCNL
jgi:hypothetical protein